MIRHLGLWMVWLAPVALAHETLTTTVLFDREIVRILNRHCVMCHVEKGPSFPLTTYEQTWLQGRRVRAEVIARHMPPWGAVPGYGRFANDNSLTLRETQFMVSWVEGLGPRNSGTVFTNVSDPNVPRREAVRALTDFDHWHLGEPQLARRLPAVTVEPRERDGVRRIALDLGLTADRRLRAIEYHPGDRRVVRAAFFTIQESGQWIGSWTPWYGFAELPKGAAYRLPAGSHVIAEIHYRGINERATDRGTLGLYFSDQASPAAVADLVVETRGERRARGSLRLAADTQVLALRPEVPRGVQSIEVSARTPDGGTQVLLFAKDIPFDWPTPYIFKEPVTLPRGAELIVVGQYGPNAAPGALPKSRIRLTASTSRIRAPRR
jgi:hypothetical protein